jgi:hypothetical protein
VWDNNIVANGLNARAVSPPPFPDVRVLDDFTTDGALAISGFLVAAIEDPAWTRGTLMETTIRSDDPNGGPSPGAGGVVAMRTTGFTAIATGQRYFGRLEYRYCQVLDPPLEVSGGRFWIGFRMPGGGGTGTNFWLTSNGGPDGANTSTGYYSIDGGATFTAEGAGWHHPFELNGVETSAETGACCLVEGDCVEDRSPAECDGLGGEWRGAEVTCAQAGCQEHTGACCRDGACAEETRTDCARNGGCARNPEWVCDGDVDGNGVVNPVDYGLVQSNFCQHGQCDEQDLCQYDLDCNGVINPFDAGLLQALFGMCDPPRPPCGGGPGGEFVGYDTTCEDSPCALGACCEDDVCTGTTREEDCEGRWYEGEDCGEAFDCPTVCTWDNNLVTNGRNGRALSPPQFPDIRVADDFDFAAGCVITSFDAGVIEDATWTPGSQITLTVRRDEGGVPQAGEPGIFTEQRFTTWTRTATGSSYFGRQEYKYSISGLSITFLGAGKYWIGLRNELGGGGGTNYWMTSDGGPDGAGSSTGYYSLDGGTTFLAEGAGWQHAFVINP